MTVADLHDSTPHTTGPSRVLAGKKLGFLLHLDSDRHPAQSYREGIELFEYAESLGYDSGWVIQRHFRQGNEHVSSPLTFLAAVAERTSRIRLGTGVVVLPLEDPLRVAEEAATLAHLSQGRLELGIGSGPFPGAWEAFGRDLDHRHELWTQSIDRLHSILDGDPVNSLGEVLHPPGESVRAHLWQATSSAESVALEQVRAAGRAGDGLQLSRATDWNRQQTSEAQARLIAAYTQALPDGATPRVLVSRAVYPDADRGTALRKLTPGARRWQSWFSALGRSGVDEVTPEEYLVRDHTRFGPADQIAASLAEDPGVASATELLVSFPPAVPSFDEHRRLLEETANGVAARLGWQRRTKRETP